MSPGNTVPLPPRSSFVLPPVMAGAGHGCKLSLRDRHKPRQSCRSGYEVPNLSPERPERALSCCSVPEEEPMLHN